MKQQIDNFDDLTSDSKDMRIRVRTFIAESCELAKSLPPKKKLLFLMRYDSGFSKEEIAEVCKCSVAKVTQGLRKISVDLDKRRKCLTDGRKYQPRKTK